MNDEMRDLETSRRAFLKKAGEIAVYVPPAMLALSAPSFKAIAQSSGAGDQRPPAPQNTLAQERVAFAQLQGRGRGRNR